MLTPHRKNEKEENKNNRKNKRKNYSVSPRTSDFANALMCVMSDVWEFVRSELHISPFNKELDHPV